jgi:hypothetical protein
MGWYCQCRRQYIAFYFKTYAAHMISGHDMAILGKVLDWSLAEHADPVSHVNLLLTNLLKEQALSSLQYTVLFDAVPPCICASVRVTSFERHDCRASALKKVAGDLAAMRKVLAMCGLTLHESDPLQKQVS